MRKKILGLVLLSVLAIAVIKSQNTNDKSTSPPTTVEAKKRIDPPAVGEELTDEYFQQVRIDATIPCQKALEGETIYGFRVHGWFGYLRPTRFNRHQRSDGVVTLMGDDVDIQTKMGEWVPGHYLCNFNPETKKATAELGVGKLPKARKE